MEERRKINVRISCKKIFIGIGIIVVSFFIFPLTARAATLSISPSSGTYSIGQTISVGVYVGSSDQAMNAVEGVVSFPKDTLEVTGISKSGSILNLWVQEPAFSNGNGTVSFEGIVYNPGFNGKSGKVLTITFRAKAQGTAQVSFNSGSVLANDGSGTNILTGMGRATFTIGEKEPAGQQTTPTTPGGAVPAAPRVVSPTHPDSAKWYSANDPIFEWSIPKDVVGVSTLFDREVSTNSGTKSAGKNSSVTYTDVSDGTWYFHIRLQNANGWGNQTNMQFNIDTAKPDNFVITELPRTTSTVPIARFYFTASDILSGIEQYTVAIDKGNAVSWKDDGSHVYQTTALNPGFHVLTARAYDKAGNYVEQSVSFEITQGPITPVVQQVAPQKPTSSKFLLTSDPVLLIGGSILFILIIILLILLIVYMWHKARYMKRHLHESPESIAELEQNLRKIFTVLRAKLEEYSLLVEKIRIEQKLHEHELTGEEDRILSDFKKYIDNAEGLMKKHFRK